MKVILSLGSNVGDRRKTLIKTLSLLREKVKIYKVSSLYETKPWGFRNQEKFLNAIVSGETELKPYELLSFIKKVEKRKGRKERFRWGPREIDVDIIFYGNLILDNGDLKIPHKDYKRRDFVIIPLLEIEKDFIDPETGKSIYDLFGVKESEEVKEIEDFSFKRDVFSEYNLSLLKIPYNTFLFETIPSTQKFLKKFFMKDTLVVSLVQTEGRGRKGNLWISKKGGLWFSFTEKPMEEIYTLPLLSSLAVARTLKRFSIKGVNIKIPNDVYIGERKICGIISEGLFESSPLGEIIGIGLNVNLNEGDLSGNFQKSPTSTFIETKEFYFLDELLNRIVEEYIELMSLFKHGSRKEIIDELILDFSVFDKPFNIKKGEKLIKVYGVSIDEEFNITVRHEDKTLEKTPIHLIP